VRGRKVLITGGFGFIGSNLAHRLIAGGADVSVLDNLDPRSGCNRANLEGIDDRLRHINADLCDIEVCRSAVTDQSLIIHCAALTSHSGSQETPIDYARTNCIGTLVLLEALRRNNPEARLIVLGTSTQVGEMVGPLIDENHCEFPTDVYSATKTAAEKYVLTMMRSRPLRATVVRLGNVYGPRAHIKTPYLGFVNFFIGRALQGKDITVFGRGNQKRNLSYVDDVVDHILRVAASDATVGQIYFATADRHMTVHEIAKAIAAHVGGQVRCVPWPQDRVALEAGDAVISNAKLKSLIGALASTDLGDGLRATAAYYRDRLPGYL